MLVTILVFYMHGFGKSNLHEYPLLLEQYVEWWCVCTRFTKVFNSGSSFSLGTVEKIVLSI